MKIIPHGNRVYLFADKHKEQTGTIFLPERHSERSRVATVMGVGNEVTKWKKGDRVLISWYVGVIIAIIGMDFEADRHRMVTEDEILGKVEEEDKLEVGVADEPKGE